MTCWACFSIQTQPSGSSKFHLHNQLPIVMKRELDAAFLSDEVHVNVNTDGVDDVEELATPSEAQSRRQAEKRPAEPSSSSGKRKKWHSLESMTEAI